MHACTHSHTSTQTHMYTHTLPRTCTRSDTLPCGPPTQMYAHMQACTHDILTSTTCKNSKTMPQLLCCVSVDRCVRPGKSAGSRSRPKHLMMFLGGVCIMPHHKSIRMRPTQLMMFLGGMCVCACIRSHMCIRPESHGVSHTDRSASTRTDTIGMDGCRGSGLESGEGHTAYR